MVLFLKFLLLIVLLGFSAFFSASETALFSLDTIKLRRLAQAGKDTSRIIKLIENPIRCLTSILAGNTLVNIATSALLTSLLIDFLGNKGLTVSIFVTTLFLLAFGEVTPKTIAIHNNEKLANFVAPFLFSFSRVISPFIFIATRICDGIILFFKWNLRSEPTLTEEEFRTVMELGHRHGVVAKSEKEMVVSVLELTTTTAQEVMTPRTDIRALDCSWDRERMLDFAKEIKHSKLPVYRDTIDNIIGIVSTKDLFLEEVKTCPDLVRTVLFIPESKKIDELFKDFHKQKTKMAVVVDEYGGTSGLVTLEDILEEIFGEIYDEFEVKENLIEQLSEKLFRISGKAPVYQVNEDCRLQIPSGDYETIAGYLLDLFGKIPQEGEKVEAPGSRFTVEKVAGRRIKSILLETQ